MNLKSSNTPHRAPFFYLITVAACLVATSAAMAEKLPNTDQRAVVPPRTLNTLRTFPEIKSKSHWQARAADIRENVLVSCGLWPLPEKTPLEAKIFGKIERDGYSIEKVYF